MPTTTKYRKTSGYRSGYAVRGGKNYEVACRRGYSGSYVNTSTAYDIPAVYPRPAVRPGPETEIKKAPVKSAPVQKKQKAAAKKKKGHRSLVQLYLKIACVFLLCCTMLYRYAMILETNAKIADMKKEYQAIVAQNQAIQAKIDKNMELGTLEEYATGKRGMMRPDTSQIFYIDMQMGDAAENKDQESDTEGKNAIQGTPGALVHAIQVLK